MVKVMGLNPKVIKSSKHSFNIKIDVNKKIRMDGYCTAMSFLSSEFGIKRSFIEGVISSVKYEKDKKNITGIEKYCFYIGDCEFTFSKYIVDVSTAHDYITDVMNESIDILNEEFLKKG